MPLNIDTEEKHFEYMTKILGYIRVSDNNTLTTPINHDLNRERKLELKIVNNKAEAIN